MTKLKTLQDLFQRYRRPGDMVIAALSLVFSVVLAANLPSQVTFVPDVVLPAQPGFWPAVAVVAMVLFSSLHLIGALVSERIPGRRAELLACIKSLEYAIWFLAYVLLVPKLGYLPSTLLFCMILTLRLGYRGRRWMLAAAVFAVVVVVLFKSVLQVRIPAGQVYDLLPASPIRTFIMSHF